MSSPITSLYNLPPQATSFVGRLPEIHNIIEKLNDPNCQLLTLVGTGGIGKTRLVIEMIQQLNPSDFEHGIFYIPLAPLSSADNITSTIINVLGIMVGNERTLQEELINFLQDRQLLLVLDNIEHLLEGVDLIVDILSATSDVKIIVTSREILNLSMEHIWRVKGMAYPQDSDPDDINQYDALNLFIERAKQVRHDFVLSENQINMIRICQLVDGLPLAIELAASWLKTLSTGDIIQQIEQGIDILSTRTHDIQARHRSIRAVFDHSWQLLTLQEQDVFPRLSVFRGGFTLEAAEQVADANLHILSGLIEKSMLRRDSTGRYDIHELLRQYANDHLRKADELEAINTDHMNYFARYTAERTEDLKGERQFDAHKELMSDYPNVLKAWEYAVQHSEYDVVGAMLEALNVNSFIYDNLYSLLSLLDSAHLKMRNPVTREHRIVANRLLAWKMYWIGIGKYDHFLYGGVESMSNMSGIELIDHSISEAKDNNDLIAQMLCHIARALFVPSVDRLAEDHLISLELSRQTQDPWYECRCLSLIVQHYYFTKRIKDSDGDSYLEQYLESALATRNPYNICMAHFLRAVAAHNRGDVLEAIKSRRITIEYWRQVGNKTQIAGSEQYLGSCYLSLGDFSQAREHIEISIKLQKQTLQNYNQSSMLLAKIEAIEGNTQAAADIYRRSILKH